VDLVHGLQPDCLIDGRIDNDMGDYHSTGDNEIPVRVLPHDWETPVTLNDTWGFRKVDDNWKDPRMLIRQLVDVVSKNGNYLLNVGPTAEGEIPKASVDRLAKVGAWLKVNGEAVYGAKPSPFPYEFEWGSVTAKTGKVYLHIIDWPSTGKFTIYGMTSKVKKAYALAAPGKAIRFTQSGADVTLDIPKAAPDAVVSVIALDVDGMPQVDTSLTHQPDGKVTLSPAFASMTGTKVLTDNRGVVRNWLTPEPKLEWDFKLVKPGAYDVVVLTNLVKSAGGWDTARWAGGHEVQVSVGGKQATKAITRDGDATDPRNPHFHEARSVVGRVVIDKTGNQHLSVQALKVNTEGKLGFRLKAVQLVPVGN